MKSKYIILIVAAMTIIAGFTVPALAKDNDKEARHEAKLEAKAKISKADAEQTALAKVPNGTVKECEIEKEKGKLIWSFDITTPDSKDITEVNVNAITGRVVSMEWETPEDQASEANEKDDDVKDKDEDSKGKDKDDDKD